LSARARGARKDQPESGISNHETRETHESRNG
jgi:hypothetical protein